MRKESKVHKLKYIILPILFIIIWQLLSSFGMLKQNLFPGPAFIMSALAKLCVNGEIVKHVLVTTYRVFAGFSIGAGIAIIFGALSGYYVKIFELCDPLIQALRAIPSLAWVPLFILWLGIGEASKISLIATGVFFPVYLNLVMGIRGVDSKYIEVGAINDFTPIETIRKILIPAALPSLLTGLRSGLGLGWMFVVAAELMGASSGLGYLMVLGQNSAAPELILGSILIFAVVGKLTDNIVVYIEKRVLHWQASFKRPANNSQVNFQKSIF